MYRNSVSLMV